MQNYLGQIDSTVKCNCDTVLTLEHLGIGNPQRMYLLCKLKSINCVNNKKS